MSKQTTEYTDGDGVRIVYDRYEPASPSAVVQIAHGWAEHAGRYERLAGALTAAGYVVYADDHRGHGRSASSTGGLGLLGPGGQDSVVHSVHDLTSLIRSSHPDLPLVLIGHSWGSFIAQRIITVWDADLAGVVLTGTTDRSAPARQPAASRPRVGFGAGASFEWLSRDEAEVARYVADPLCGFQRPQTQSVEPGRVVPEGGGPRAGLPIAIFNGTDDPVGGAEGGRALRDRYVGTGCTDVTLQLYDGARHELFNELNRDEVVADLLNWVASRLRR